MDLSKIMLVSFMTGAFMSILTIVAFTSIFLITQSINGTDYKVVKIRKRDVNDRTRTH